MRKFPILWSRAETKTDNPFPNGIPWGMLNEEWAMDNHRQTLTRLAERGGLSPSEALANIERYSLSMMLREDVAIFKLRNLVSEHIDAEQKFYLHTAQPPYIISKLWEESHRNHPTGINPGAFMLGCKAMWKHMQTEIEDLKQQINQLKNKTHE